MTEWIAAVVPDGHEESRRAAGSLRAVAGTVAATASFAARDARPGHEDFDGVTAAAYAEATHRISQDAGFLADDLRALATALAVHADRVAEVRRVMLHAHEAAARAGLRTSGSNIYRPDCPTDAQSAAYDVLRARVADANTVLDQADAAWAAALEEHAGVPVEPLAPRYLDDGALPFVPAAPWPPRTEHWPGGARDGQVPFLPGQDAPAEDGRPTIADDREPPRPDRSEPVDRPAPPADAGVLGRAEEDPGARRDPHVLGRLPAEWRPHVDGHAGWDPHTGWDPHLGWDPHTGWDPHLGWDPAPDCGR